MSLLRIIAKPLPNEYPAYSAKYMDLLKNDGLVLYHLMNNFLEIRHNITQLSSDILHYRYAPEKWNIKETLVHMMDDERIYAYRALCFARGEKQKLPGFDQDSYDALSGASARSIQSIFAEYEAVRHATVAMFNAFTDEMLLRMGYSDENNSHRSVRAFVYHIAGHELRHWEIIKERYLERSASGGTY